MIVSRENGHQRPVATGRSALYLRLVTNATELGAYLTYLRTRADLSKREAARRAGIGSSAFWGEVERGYQIAGGQKRKTAPSPQKLLQMARAVNARPSETQRLFELAGYAELYTGIIQHGLHLRPDVPPSAEAGVTNDFSLTHDEREMLMGMLRTIRQAKRADVANDAVEEDE